MVDVALESGVGTPNEFGGVGFGQGDEGGSGVVVVGLESTIDRRDVGKVLAGAFTMNTMGGAVEPGVGERGDPVQALPIKAAGMREAEAHLGSCLGHLENTGGLRPHVLGGRCWNG